MSTITQGFLDHKVFQIVSEVAASKGVRAFVIGGYVRDCFLGRPSKDIDIVVEGSGIEIAEAVGEMVHSNVSVFRNFGTAMLRYKGIEVEFSDPDHVVLMFSPMNGDEAFSRLVEALSSLARREKILLLPPRPVAGEAAFPPAQALLMAGERVSVEESLGRVLADFSVGCPPAVPIVTVGERIGEDAVSAFRYFGIKSVTVVKE